MNAVAVLSGWLRTIFAGPILYREFRASFKSKKFFWGHFVTLSIFAVGILFVLLGMSSRQSFDLSTAGTRLFSVLIALQGMAAFLVYPAFGVTSIVGEREKDTIDLLCLTTLSPAAIVWGKVAAALAYVILFLSSTFPLVALCFLLGGLSPWEVVLAYVLLWLQAVPIVVVSVFASAMARTSQRAITTTYGILVFLGIPSFAALAEVIDHAYSRYGYGGSLFGDLLTLDARDLATTLLISAHLYGGAISFLLVAAVTRLKGSAEDRSTGYKLYYLIAVGGGVLLWVFLGWLWRDDLSGFEGYRIGLAGMTVLLVLAVLSTALACDDLVPGRRIRRRAARLNAERRLAALLVPGARSGARFALVTNFIIYLVGPGAYFIFVLTDKAWAITRRGADLAPSFGYTALVCWSYVAFLSALGFWLTSWLRKATTARLFWGGCMIGTLICVPLFDMVLAQTQSRSGIETTVGHSFINYLNLPMTLSSVWEGVENPRSAFVPYMYSVGSGEIPGFLIFVISHLVLAACLWKAAVRGWRLRTESVIAAEEVVRIGLAEDDPETVEPLA